MRSLPTIYLIIKYQAFVPIKYPFQVTWKELDAGDVFEVSLDKQHGAHNVPNARRKNHSCYFFQREEKAQPINSYGLM